MTWDDVRALGLALPGMEASTSYGTPALKVRGRLVTRLRTEDESLVLLGIPVDAHRGRSRNLPRHTA